MNLFRPKVEAPRRPHADDTNRPRPAADAKPKVTSHEGGAELNLGVLKLSGKKQLQAMNEVNIINGRR